MRRWIFSKSARHVHLIVLVKVLPVLFDLLSTLLGFLSISRCSFYRLTSSGCCDTVTHNYAHDAYLCMKAFVQFDFGIVALSSQPSPPTGMTYIKRLDKVLTDCDISCQRNISKIKCHHRPMRFSDCNCGCIGDPFRYQLSIQRKTGQIGCMS